MTSFQDNGSGTINSAEFPPSVAGGDLLFLYIENKYPSVIPVTPVGWTLIAQIAGGSGASGLDAGQVTTSIYIKIADGSETGSVSISFSGSGANSSVCRMLSVRSDIGPRVHFDILVGTAAQNAGNNVLWSATTTQSMDMLTNDLVLVFNGINTDAFTYGTHTLTQSGTTFGSRTQINSSATSGGDDSRLLAVRCVVTSGGGTGTVNFQMTATGSTADSSAGSTVVVRIRDYRKSVFNFC